MALSVQTRTVTYNGDGATTLWPIPFPYADPSHIFLYRTDPGGPALGSGASQVTPGTYGVSAAGASGTVTYGTGNPLPVGSSILIARLVPYTQLVALTNQDGFFPDVIEGSLDLLVEMGQQLRDEETALDARLTADEVTIAAQGVEIAADTAAIQIHAAELARALLVADGGQGVIPAASARASRVLGFDSGGAVALYEGSDNSTNMATALGGSRSRTLAEHFGDVINVRDFPGSGNDPTPAILAAVEVGRLRGARVFFPADNYTTTATIVVTGSHQMLEGDNRGGTFITPLFSTGDAIRFSGGIEFSGLRGLTIQPPIGVTAIRTTGNNSGLDFSDFRIHGGADGIVLDAADLGVGSIITKLSNFYIQNCAGAGVIVGSGTGWHQDVFIESGGISTCNVGLNLVNASGVYVSNLSTVLCVSAGVNFEPGNGGRVIFCFFNTVLADSVSAGNGWVFDPQGTGWVAGVECNDCWASACSAHGIVFGSASVNDVKWLGGQIRANGAHGVNMQAGTNLKVAQASIFYNGQSVASSAGIFVQPGLKRFSLIGNIVGDGGYESMTGAPQTQAYGILVPTGAGTDNYVITGNTCLGNLTADFTDNGPVGAHKAVGMNA